MVKADPKRNYYADLDLTATASTDDIKKQFRKLARIYHPDRNPGNEVEYVPKFQAIQAAHEILCDPDQRAKYDADRRRLGYGPRTSPQQGRAGQARAAWQQYGANVPPRPPFAPGASAYNAYREAQNAGTGGPQTPPRPPPNPRERMKTSSGFYRPAPGTTRWTEGKPPPQPGYRYTHAPPPQPQPTPSSHDDANMYFDAFSKMNPNKGPANNGRRSSYAGPSGTSTPERGRKKSGFDPKVAGYDEPSAKMSGYNTRPRTGYDASGPPSEADVSGNSNQEEPRAAKPMASSDFAEEASKRTRTKKAERTAAKKKASEVQAERKAAEERRRASAGTFGFASARSGSEADSSGSNIKKPMAPGERVKAMPSKKWKNMPRSEETLANDAGRRQSAGEANDAASTESMYDTFSFSFPTLKPQLAQGGLEDPFSAPSVYSASCQSTTDGRRLQKTLRPRDLKDKRLLDHINRCATEWPRASSPSKSPERFPDAETTIPQPRSAGWFAFPPQSIKPLASQTLFTRQETKPDSFSSFATGNAAGKMPDMSFKSNATSDEQTPDKKSGTFSSMPRFNFHVFEGKTGVIYEEMSPPKTASEAFNFSGDDSTPKASSFFPKSNGFANSNSAGVSSKKLDDASSRDDKASPENDLIAQMKNLPKNTFETFTTSKDYFTDKFPTQSSSSSSSEFPKASPSIDTAFSPDNWTSGTFTFQSGNASATQKAPVPPTAPDAPRDEATGAAAEDTAKSVPGPTVEEVPDSPKKPTPDQSTSVPPLQSVDASGATADKPIPVTFSADDWKETFKPAVFELKDPVTLPSQSGQGTKPAASTRKGSTQRIKSPSKGGEKFPTRGEPARVGSATRPIVVEEYEKSNDADADVDAMDIDTPPANPTDSRAPRLVRMPASRADWTATSSAPAIVPIQQEKNVMPSVPSSPSEKSRKPSLKTAKLPAAPESPSSLNLSSLKSHLSSQDSTDLTDLHVNLPFESRASTHIPKQYDDITSIQSRPKAPRAPVFPTSGTISNQQYRNLLAAMSRYMGDFHKYEAEVLAQFSLRCKEGARFGTGIPSTDATSLLDAKGEPKGKGVLAYAEALREEKSMREDWLRATDDYMHVVAGWALLKQMVMDRGFAKSGIAPPPSSAAAAGAQ